jgi:thiamine biosynthesis protein ThiI
MSISAQLNEGAVKPDLTRLSQRILVRCPDITLKGQNQAYFQRTLIDNIDHRLNALDAKMTVKGAHGRIYIESAKSPPATIEAALRALRETPGIDSIANAQWVRPKDVRLDGSSWSLIEAAMIEMARESYRPDASFAVHVNRVDKRLPIDSMEMARRFGNAIRQHSHWERVDLKHRDQTFYVDIYPDGVYLYDRKIKGVGGLPTGTGGRILGLLSGGIDSPVAAYLLAKRGAQVDLLHMSASHVDQRNQGSSVVARLAQRLSCYCLRTRLYIVPYTYFDLAVAKRRSGFEALLFRRFLLRVAADLARSIGARALVTGDSLGQVASQTLENLASTSQAVDTLILRPLIGMNKQEIISLAQSIGSYETSIEPYKDCCALLTSRPRTRSNVARLKALEQEINDYDALIDKTLEDTFCFEYDCGQQVGA